MAVSVGRPDTSRGVTTVSRAPRRRRALRGRGGAPRGGAVAPPVRRAARGGPGADREGRARRASCGDAAQAPPACDLGKGPCTAPLTGGGEVTLELGPRPLRTMRELAVTADVRAAGRRWRAPRCSVSFAMKGMEMGDNTAALAPAGGGRFAGKAVLVRCPSGRKDWTADVTVAQPGAAPRTARFDAHGGRVTDAVAMAFVTGLLGGFGHCIGMCGPLVGSFALATGRARPAPLARGAARVPRRAGHDVRACSAR